MNPPSAEEQIEFLVKLQRLLQEGQFVATYKYALLLSLADIAVEAGDDSGGQLAISTSKIAEKFVRYYWRQTAPFIGQTGKSELGILKQNTGRQAGVLRLLEETRKAFSGSIVELQRNTKLWKTILSDVEQIVCVMPLWKLQTVGGSTIDFLYDNVGKGRSITLKYGVTFCLRKFHGIVCDLVQSAWVNYVRRFNAEILGTTTDLHEFLFGSERNNLGAVVPVLMEIQKAECFYCGKRLDRGAVHVDHFIPWSRYSVDLGHNFVLADASCNSKKGARIAAVEHLHRWAERNAAFGEVLSQEYSERGVTNDLPASIQVATWIYSQTEASKGLTWRGGEVLVPLGSEWRTICGRN